MQAAVSEMAVSRDVPANWAGASAGETVWVRGLDQVEVTAAREGRRA